MSNHSYLLDRLAALVELSKDIAQVSVKECRTKIKLKRAELIKSSYSDFGCDRKYAQAINFLADDLYGPDDLTTRATELQRAGPAMVKILPDAVLATVVKALEFAEITIEIDMQQCRYVKENDKKYNILDDVTFAELVRVATNPEILLRQLQLALSIGNEIQSVVNKPFISTALKMCRKPAKLMGLAGLQDFLERGFFAFKAMPNANRFLRCFEEREKKIIDNIFSMTEGPFAIVS